MALEQHQPLHYPRCRHNRLGYSASFVYTPRTADTPQVPLTSRQQTYKGGLTVNTALVPPDTTPCLINADNDKSFNQFIGYSISNLVQLNPSAQVQITMSSKYQACLLC